MGKWCGCGLNGLVGRADRGRADAEVARIGVARSGSGARGMDQACAGDDVAADASTAAGRGFDGRGQVMKSSIGMA